MAGDTFAPLVFEAEAIGDKIAGNILDECAAELALLVKAGARHLNETDELYKVVLTGGLWKSGDALMDRFKSNLSQNFLLIQPELPPVYGAVIEALIRAEKEYIIRADKFHHGCYMWEKYTEKEKYLRLGTNGDFRDNFKNTLKQYSNKATI